MERIALIPNEGPVGNEEPLIEFSDSLQRMAILWTHESGKENTIEIWQLNTIPSAELAHWAKVSSLCYWSHVTVWCYQIVTVHRKWLV